MKVLIDKQKYS